MKRDMDLIRKILLAVEAEEIRSLYVSSFPSDESDGEVELGALQYHARLIYGAGMAISIYDRHFGELPSELTWASCDFLDTIRDDDVWQKTKTGASKAAGAGFGFIVELAKGYAKAELQKLGLPLL